MANKDDDYETGFGKPPKRHQFKKGTSGNPKGRPPGARNLVCAVRDALSEKVAVTESGKRKTISKLEAAAKQLANKAANGDARAINQLIGLVPLLGDGADLSDAVERLGPDDTEVADKIIERILARGKGEAVSNSEGGKS